MAHIYISELCYVKCKIIMSLYVIVACLEYVHTAFHICLGVKWVENPNICQNDKKSVDVG